MSETLVRVDHDILFTEYDITYIKNWSKKIPYPIKSIHIRRSCGGRTHALITIACDISQLDELLIRAILHDDARRIRGDLERYALNSPIFGLCFDEKYDSKTDTKTKAGEWIKIK